MPANSFLSRWLGIFAAPVIHGMHHGRPLFFLLLLLVSLPAPAAQDSAEWQPPHQRLPAPGFKAMSLRGEPLELADYRGRTVLLHFWATWCRPCVRELPALQTLQEDCGTDRLRIITVVADPGADGPIRKFVHKMAFGLPVIHAGNLALRKAYEVRFLPTTYLIGADGRFIARLIGAGDWHSETLRGEIRRSGVDCQ